MHGHDLVRLGRLKAVAAVAFIAEAMCNRLGGLYVLVVGVPMIAGIEKRLYFMLGYVRIG
jgi:hypothetical protein